MPFGRRLISQWSHQLLGDPERRVILVFAPTATQAAPAVNHIHQGAAHVPLWLYCGEQPDPDTISQCEQVRVSRSPRQLLWRARQDAQGRRVALTLAVWDGVRASWATKLPFLLFPPFRVLLMNEQPGFFSPSPLILAEHLGRRLRDSAVSAWRRMGDLRRGYVGWLRRAFDEGSDETEGGFLHWRSLGRRVVLFCWQRLMISLELSARRWLRQAIHPEPQIRSYKLGQGTLVEIYRYRFKSWNRKRLEHMLTTSPARYILLLQGQEHAGYDDLLPLFADERTFAVARQAEFRHWSEQLLPRAPFRLLEPGEATRTVAPVSPALLIDAGKWRALGVPHTLVPGAALFLVFWQAAAAGWRSYTVGSRQFVGQASHWPVEETEFALRVLLDRDLRRQGPADQQRDRGSITVASEGQRPPREGRRQVLVLSPFLPYPLSHGGAVRIYNLCRALREQVDFVLVTRRERNDRVDYAHLHEVFSTLR